MGRVWWRSPWLPFGAAIVPFVLTLRAGAVPGGYWMTGLAAFACWVVVGVAWLVSAFLAVRALPAPRSRNLVRLWAFLAVPLVSLAAYVTVKTGATAHAPLKVNRSSLEALATEVWESPEGHVFDRSFAWFTISSAIREPGTGCVVMTVEGAGLLNATGYAHCPDRAPVSAVAGTDGYRFKPVDGPWHVFVLEW